MTHPRVFPDAIDHPTDPAPPSRVCRGFTPLLAGNAAERGRRSPLSRHRRRPGAAVVLAWLSVGCGTFVTATSLNAPPRPLAPVPPHEVEVFVSGPPQRDSVDVALLEVEQTQSYNRRGTDYMIERLRATAGAMGCDAVVLVGATEHSANDDTLFDNDSKTLIASCIVYTGLERAAASDF